MIAFVLRRVFQLGLIASLAGQAMAQSVGEYAAPAKWQIHVGDDRCIATHDYRVGGQEWVVGFEPRPTTDETSLMLVAPAAASDLRQAHLRTADAPLDASGLSLDVKDPSGHRLYSAPLTHAELARLSSNGSLQLDDQGHITNFALTDGPQVQQYLDSCVRELLTGW